MKNWGMAFIALSILLTLVLAGRIVQRHTPAELETTSGLIVVKDEESGRFRSPSAEEYAAFKLQTAPTRTAEPILEHREDGSLRLIPGIEHISYSKATVLEDGGRDITCETGALGLHVHAEGEKHDR
jgi:hypothetical protein